MMIRLIYNAGVVNKTADNHVNWHKVNSTAVLWKSSRPISKTSTFPVLCFLYLLPHCYLTMLTNCPDSLFNAKDFICHVNKAFFKLLIICNLPVPHEGQVRIKKRERPVEGVRITDSSHLTPDPRSALPGALLQHTYWLLSLEKVRDKKKKEAMTLHSPRSCRRSAPKPRREGSAEKTNIAGLRAGLINSLDLLKHEV